MSDFLRKIFAASPEDHTTTLNPASWLYDILGSGPTSSGMNITEKNSIRSTTVWRCVNLIANTIASLPLNVYERTPDGRRIASNHQMHHKLHDEPNKRHSSYTWRQLNLVPAMLAGNGYSFIQRKGIQPDQFIPLDAAIVNPYVDDDTGSLMYRVNGFEKDVHQLDMLHFPGLGFDGVKGISVIGSVGKEAIGLALSMEQYAGRLHKNSTVARGVIESPDSLLGNPERVANLRQGFRKMLEGDDAFIPLDAGMKWQSLSISPADAQTIEERKFQVSEICALFGVMPWMVGLSETSSTWGTGIEQQMIAFVKFVLRPWLVMMEQEINRKLFANGKFYCEFVVDGLLRGDSAARSEYYQKAIRNSIMSPNEVRKLENLPPDPDGDQLLADQTLIPLEKLGQTEATTNE